MATSSALKRSSLSSDIEAPVPLTRASTVPAVLRVPPASLSHLVPDDAVQPLSPRRLSGYDNGHGSASEYRRRRAKLDGHDGRGRRKRAWKKLLWVKQSYPDNYTDKATFLENLQRNPRLKPYDFWPLVADSTVIVQHVCSVIIFVVCFVGIFQERVSPVSVVGGGSLATALGWLLWDRWAGTEPTESAGAGPSRSRSAGGRPYRHGPGDGGTGDEHSTGAPPTANSSLSNLPSAASSASNLVHSQGEWRQRPQISSHHSGAWAPLTSPSATSVLSTASQTSGTGTGTGTGSARRHRPRERRDTSPAQRHRPSSPLPHGRARVRLNTIKSAALIYFTLLGLSPILKSLTRSTSSDSIWAMSFWLLAINVFFFDYSSAWVGVTKFPVAPLSTNAALMASTVLASRLPSTGQVFSLTLFSIEVFGLFPVFRSYARHRRWAYHAALTALLVLGAGGGVGVIVSAPGADDRWPWRGAMGGMFVGCALTALVMGGCSWWLIGLQKYKNEIYGPWDPARPVIASTMYWQADRE